MPGLPDIFVVGLGVSGFAQVTREVEQALSLCKSIFYVHTEPFIDTYLKRFTDHVVDLKTLYREGGPRLDTYLQMADEVLDAASGGGPVAFALYGHPLNFVSPSQEIIRVGAERGLRVEVLAGISALDTLMIDIGFDPGRAGLLQYEASFLLAYRPPLDARVPCLIWQIGAVEAGTHAPGLSRPERFFRMRDCLLETYPPDARCALATSASNPLIDPEVIWTTVSEFSELAKYITGITTMFLPAHQNTHMIADADFVRDYNDPEHVDQLLSFKGDRIPRELLNSNELQFVPMAQAGHVSAIVSRD